MEKDITFLISSLHSIVSSSDPAMFKAYLFLLSLSTTRFAAEPAEANKALGKMIDMVGSMRSAELLPVGRLLTHSLALVNIAETQHRFRMIRKEEEDHVSPSLLLLEKETKEHREDSVRGTIESIFTDEGSDDDKVKEAIFRKLQKQQVELVLTAHPTEVNRRVLLNKQRKISELLSRLDRNDLSSLDKIESTKRIQSVIASIWGADEIRRSKPSVLKEAAGGVAVIQSVLWDAVPTFLRALDTQCKLYLNRDLPLDCVPIKFASWIGGDRDGNPNVTPSITVKVHLMHRRIAAKLLIDDLIALEDDLAISTMYSDEMRQLATSVTEPNQHTRELYRRVISHLRRRLEATVSYCEGMEFSDNMPHTSHGSFDADIGPNDSARPITKTSEILNPMLTMHDSLLRTGYGNVASHLLTDVIRRLRCFGVNLVPLDIREESTVHNNALDAITEYIGVQRYSTLSEDERIAFLEKELVHSKRPLFDNDAIDNLPFDSDVKKTLRVFKEISRFEAESLGAYVISQAKVASDVLVVMLLQKQFGMTSTGGNMMRIVPLFETLTDLTNAPDTCDRLFSVPAYKSAIGGEQEIMVGYSDSAKDAGRIAACWAQYDSQEKVTNVAKKHDVQLTFFHGKGGTVGRGGNPSVYRAVVGGHPPSTINGRFRVTEQGEMITQNFGSLPMAMRTLDIYTSSVLREAFIKPVNPPKKWREQMEKLSEVSCAAYRKLVREVPVFVPYFRKSTPEQELQLLNVGSRPSKRNPKGGIESLRAIPWTFAWSQSRLQLSAWLGAGEAFNFKTEEDFHEVNDMYNQWPWFRETIDLVAMTLSKSDYSISENYDKQLIVNEDELNLGEEIRANLKLTRKGLLRVTGYDDADAGFKTLTSTMKNRAPYVDCLNVIQAELLKRFRAGIGGGEAVDANERQCVEDALIVTINGIAQGLRNSG